MWQHTHIFHLPKVYLSVGKMCESLLIVWDPILIYICQTSGRSGHCFFIIYILPFSLQKKKKVKTDNNRTWNIMEFAVLPFFPAKWVEWQLRSWADRKGLAVSPLFVQFIFSSCSFVRDYYDLWFKYLQLYMLLLCNGLVFIQQVISDLLLKDCPQWRNQPFESCSTALNKARLKRCNHQCLPKAGIIME